MAIKKIRVKNFKSFKDLELNLGNLNILIGANASGKSNFIQIFKFLRDIVTFGLERAILYQGGIEYIRNINFRHDPIFFEITYSYQQNESNGAELSALPTLPDFKIYEIVYTLSIESNKDDSGFRVSEDRVLCKYRNKDNEINELVISNVNGKIVLSTNQTVGSEIDLKDFYRNLFDTLKNTQLEFLAGSLSTVLERFRIPDKSTLLENHDLLVPFVNLSYFGNLTIYDFNPKLSKQAVPMAGNAFLAEDGLNLPIVLKIILDNDNEKREFINLMTYFLDFVKDLRIQKTIDKRFFLELSEIYSDGQYLPPFLISDGTVNIANLIITLFFDAMKLTIIEEPERNIHPSLISKVVSLMKDASERKQIIATTHNPEMVKHADLKDVLLAFRDENGFTSIINPSDNKDVDTFLENGMRLEDLYVDNLLEI